MLINSSKKIVFSIILGVVSAGMAEAADYSFLEGQRATLADVSLQNGNTLVGQVVDAQGQPLHNEGVSILHEGNEIAMALTSEEGLFTASGLQGGVYSLVVDGTPTNFRVWSQDTAPPSANAAALVVAQGNAVRSQIGDGGLGRAGLYAAVGGATFFAIKATTDDSDASGS